MTYTPHTWRSDREFIKWVRSQPNPTPIEKELADRLERKLGIA